MWSGARRVSAIALNTYREAVRARLLLGLAALALATALYSIAVGESRAENAPRVVADLGAASTSIYAVVAALIIGATSLYRELEQKTIFPISARPLVAGYLVGKYAGTLLTLAVFIALDAATVLLILARHGGRSWTVLGISVGWDSVGACAGRLALASGAHLCTDSWAVAVLFLAGWLAGGLPDERRVVLGSCALTFLEIMIVSGIAAPFPRFRLRFSRRCSRWACS